MIGVMKKKNKKLMKCTNITINNYSTLSSFSSPSTAKAEVEAMAKISGGGSFEDATLPSF
jgi:hypothetical protein